MTPYAYALSAVIALTTASSQYCNAQTGVDPGTRAQRLWLSTASHLGPNGVCIDNIGNIISSESDAGKVIVRKLSGLDGSQQWITILPSDGKMLHVYMGVDPFGDVFAFNEVIPFGESAYYVAFKLSRFDGSVVWARRISGRLQSSGLNGITLDSAGNLIFSGKNHLNYAYISKINGLSGSVDWENISMETSSQINENSNTFRGEIQALCVAGRGPIYALSGSQLARFSPDTGVLSWVSNSVSNLEGLIALAVDYRGDVFTAGYRLLGNNSRVHATSKFDGVVGSLLWRDETSVRQFNLDVPRSVLVDRQGDVYTYGPLDGSAVLYKRSGETGNVLWNLSFGSSDPGAGKYFDCEVDAGQNVTVVNSGVLWSISGIDGSVRWYADHADSDLRLKQYYFSQWNSFSTSPTGAIHLGYGFIDPDTQVAKTTVCKLIPASSSLRRAAIDFRNFGHPLVFWDYGHLETSDVLGIHFRQVPGALSPMVVDSQQSVQWFRIAD